MGVLRDALTCQLRLLLTHVSLSQSPARRGLTMRSHDRRPGLHLALALVLAALPFAALLSGVSAVDACVIDGVDAVRIHHIQGAGHVSPCLGDSVNDVL